MVKELNIIGLTGCSNKIRKEYQQLNGKIRSSEKPDTEESRRFWSNIWGAGKSHNKNAEWLKELQSERNKINLGQHTNNH